MRVLKRYLYRLVRAWVFVAITVVDVVVFIITLFYPYSLPVLYTRYLTIAVAIVAYFLANLRIFSELEPKAEVQLTPIPRPYKVQYPKAAKAKDCSGEHPHLGKSGLPPFAVLELNLEATNTGGEDGELMYELDIENSELPNLLTFDYRTRCEGQLSKMIPAGVERHRIHLTIRFVTTEILDPTYFAQVLKSLSCDTYTIVVRYHTRHSRGESKQRTLEVTGNFQYFCKALIHDWKQYGFDRLVQEYEFADLPPCSEPS